MSSPYLSRATTNNPVTVKRSTNHLNGSAQRPESTFFGTRMQPDKEFISLDDPMDMYSRYISSLFPFINYCVIVWFAQEPGLRTLGLVLMSTLNLYISRMVAWRTTTMPWPLRAETTLADWGGGQMKQAMRKNQIGALNRLVPVRCRLKEGGVDSLQDEIIQTLSGKENISNCVKHRDWEQVV